MPSKKHLIAPSRSLPGKGVWEGMIPRATSVSFDKQLGARHWGTGCSPVLWGGGRSAPRTEDLPSVQPLLAPLSCNAGIRKRASGSKRHFNQNR